MVKIVKEIGEKYVKAHRSNDFEFGIIGEIIAEIHSQPINVQSQLVELYVEIGQELLDREISVNTYDKESFLNRIRKWKTEKKKRAEAEDEVSIEDDFEDKLIQLLKCAGEQLKILRRVFLKFGADNPGETQILLLHDSHSKTLIYEKIRDEFREDCKVFNVIEFIKELKQKDNHSLITKKYLCLLTLSPQPVHSDTIDDLFSDIDGYFKPIYQVKIINNKDFDGEFYDEKEDNLETIKRELKYLVSINLTNEELSGSEEKILKKFFHKNFCHTLQYRIINKGFSGAKVLFIRPYTHSSNSIRSVIKISDLKSKKGKEKIDIEASQFHKHVELPDSHYKIDVAETEKHKAIRYYFASMDSRMRSESFSDKLAERNNEDLLNIEYLLYIIEKLFNITLFKDWDDNIRKSINIKDCYGRYVSIDKIFNKVAEIKNEKRIDLEKHGILGDFLKIFDLKIESYSKVCHGDLHTDNFFIDDKDNVFLIDFGDTKQCHSLIDFVTLECAIKFRHLPQYIEINELMEVENELLAKEDTFKPDYNFMSIKREDLKQYFQLINKIREFSLKHIFSNRIEYFVSLFMITFRQIKYDGLNQIYALKSAELLAEKIIKDLVIK